MEVDLVPLIVSTLDIIFLVLGIVLVAIVGWAAKKFADKTGIEQNDLMLSHIENMIANGLALMKKKTLQELLDADITVKIDNPKIAFVANYVISQAPTYLSKLKIDEVKLAALIESKI